MILTFHVKHRQEAPAVPTINRFRIHWTGFTGSPGVNTLYFTSGADPAPAWRTFFSAIAARLPSVVSISFDSTGDTIDDTTGLVNGSWSASSAAPVAGTDASSYAGPVGACINWTTGTIVNGHRVRGRSYLVPLGGSSYDADGSLGSGTLTSLRGALATYVASSSGLAQVVFRRPGSPGGAGHVAVTGANIPDLAAVLRSRRS